MFGWLRRWRTRRAREIFHFWDGAKWVYADPIAIDRKLTEQNKDWQKLIGFLKVDFADQMPPHVLAAAQEESLKCHKRLVDIIRVAFDAKPLAADGTGLTESETFNLLTQWITFQGGLVEAAGPFSISPAFAGPSPPDLDTGNLPASTSDASVSPNDKPDSSPKGSGPQSAGRLESDLVTTGGA